MPNTKTEYWRGVSNSACCDQWKCSRENIGCRIVFSGSSRDVESAEEWNWILTWRMKRKHFHSSLSVWYLSMRNPSPTMFVCVSVCVCFPDDVSDRCLILKAWSWIFSFVFLLLFCAFLKRYGTYAWVLEYMNFHESGCGSEDSFRMERCTLFNLLPWLCARRSFDKNSFVFYSIISFGQWKNKFFIISSSFDLFKISKKI